MPFYLNNGKILHFFAKWRKIYILSQLKAAISATSSFAPSNLLKSKRSTGSAATPYRGAAHQQANGYEVAVRPREAVAQGDGASASCYGEEGGVQRGWQSMEEILPSPLALFASFSG